MRDGVHLYQTSLCWGQGESFVLLVCSAFRRMEGRQHLNMLLFSALWKCPLCMSQHVALLLNLSAPEADSELPGRPNTEGMAIRVYLLSWVHVEMRWSNTSARASDEMRTWPGCWNEGRSGRVWTAW
jgi:hypothetical protein